jgi:hypothetical protein
VRGFVGAASASQQTRLALTCGLAHRTAA